jgi:formylmethanofuran dehydrogenase subunit E
MNNMKLAVISILFSVLLLSCNAPAKNVKMSSDNNSEQTSWYYPEWAANSPYAPTFKMLDTESSLGPYAEQTKTITLKDLIQMHGHLCDGLVTASCGLKLGLDKLYPDGVIDRTDTCCITNNSPCFGDAAAYLTGGRIRFGTQKIDPNLGNEIIIYRISTKQAVKISLEKGVFPSELEELEKKIKSGNFTVEQMRLCQNLGWDFAESLVNKPLSKSFVVENLNGFVWKSDNYIHQGPRSDIRNKNVK